MYADVRIYINKVIPNPKNPDPVYEDVEINLSGSDLLDELEIGGVITRVEVWEGDVLKREDKYQRIPKQVPVKEEAKPLPAYKPLTVQGSGMGASKGYIPPGKLTPLRTRLAPEQLNKIGSHMRNIYGNLITEMEATAKAWRTDPRRKMWLEGSWDIPEEEKDSGPKDPNKK